MHPTESATPHPLTGDGREITSGVRLRSEWAFRWAAVVASALLYSAAFPPIGWASLGWIALAPLLVAVGGTGPATSFLMGLFWSLLVGAGTASFLPDMIQSYFGLLPYQALIGACGLVVQTGGIHAVAVCAIAWLERRRRVGPFAVAAIWGFGEWLRTVLPPQNPWALAGYAQVDESPVVQLAEWIGIVGVGMFLALANAIVADVARRRISTASLAFAAATLSTALLLGVWLESRVVSLDAEHRVAMIQGARVLESRQLLEEENDILELHTELSRVAAGMRPKLILWPEYALDRSVSVDDPADRTLASLSKALETQLLVGLLTSDEIDGREGLRNSVVLYEAGSRVDRYDKVLPMPYAERAMAISAGMGPLVDIEAGANRRPLDSAAGRLGIVLCNEVMSSHAVRETVQQGAEVLVNPANDDWFGAIGAELQLQIAQARAIETRRIVLRPTRSGVTSVIDAKGHVRRRAPSKRPEVLVADISPGLERTLYVLLGDTIAVCAALALVVAPQILRIRLR